VQRCHPYKACASTVYGILTRAGLSLIIGRLLGHIQTATTARYAHLDNHPLRRASEVFAGRTKSALDRKPASIVVLRTGPLEGSR
jgi:hypothetical protein